MIGYLISPSKVAIMECFYICPMASHTVEEKGNETSNLIKVTPLLHGVRHRGNAEQCATGSGFLWKTAKEVV